MDNLNEENVTIQQTIFSTIENFIGDIIGAEFIEEYDIDTTSTLTVDLEMESIEIVELSEKIKKHYGSKVDFTNWMSTLELDQIINLSIQDIINYIEECQV